MAVPITRIQPGQEIGRCQVVREIGRGGMGAVYLASHRTLRVDVALKILSPELAHNNPILADRFIREAQMAARIRHPNVVSVMDADQDKSTDLYFIIQEYMAGGTLAWHLRHGPLPEKKILGIMLGIAQALVVAQEAGIVHRDIKPDNILLDNRGTPKLADLGLAKHALDTRTSLTLGGAFMGTPAYMSPDQARDAKSVTNQDDIYSLGATCFECLTGRAPFTGDTPYNIMTALLTNPTPRARQVNSAVGEAMDLICYKMMVKERALRYPDAKSLIQDLEKVQVGSTSGWKHLLAAQLPEAALESGVEAKKLGVQKAQLPSINSGDPSLPRKRRAAHLRPLTSVHPDLGSKSEYSVFNALLTLTLGATVFSIGVLFIGQYYPFTAPPVVSSVVPVVAMVPTPTTTHTHTHSHSHSPHPWETETTPDYPNRPLIIAPTPAPTVVPTPDLISKAVPTETVPIVPSLPTQVPLNTTPLLVGPTQQPFFPSTFPSTNPLLVVSPVPALPATPGPASATPTADGAFAARLLASETLAGHPTELLDIKGDQDKYSLTPTTWTMVFYDVTAKRHARYVTVSQGRCKAKDYLIGYRLEYKEDEVIPDSDLTFDSNQAFLTARALYPSVKVTSSAIRLIHEKDSVPPYRWEVSLWTEGDDNDQRHFATVTVNASADGSVVKNQPDD